MQTESCVNILSDFMESDAQISIKNEAVSVNEKTENVSLVSDI